MPTLPGTSRPGAVPVLGVPGDGLVAPVPFEDLPEPLRGELAARVERLGYLGGFFSVAAHQPDPLLRGAYADEEGASRTAELSGVARFTAVLLLLGRYVAHAMVARVLGLGPPVSLDPPLAPTRTASPRRTP